MTRLTKYIAIIFALLGSMLLSACVEESPLIDRSGSYKKPPAPPVGIVATPYSRSVELKWDTVLYTTQYNIYVAASNRLTSDNYESLPEGRLINSKLPEIVVDGLTNGTEYYFLVSATNFYGESSPSDRLTATPILSIPITPRGIVPIARDRAVDLQWKKIEDATLYRIYMSSDVALTINNYDNMIETATPYTSINNLIIGTTYYFILTAVNDVGESNPSEVLIAIPRLLPTATISTNYGEISIELYDQLAPNTVSNFIDYAEALFYNGTIFHRVIEGFMIQGGGYLPTLEMKPRNAPIPNEANNGLSNLTGTIAMARDPNNPHSATSEFFINTVNNNGENEDLDYKVDNWGFSVFGRVTTGIEFVHNIEQEPTYYFSDTHKNVPINNVVINSIVINNN